ncbi:ABC-type antimicrobial peptide transport system permease subunit [Algoriphagus iocasae]|uniref:ABC-type antimicrobial peptide transport system permease subunit n=1 Tax=Algoriphagus iocasae TaxID=1836499 RepID=A0A841MTS0_9BACT|nr:ABC transporter permease [Algoriphagus iocasae]MBB6327506.1 ABC-type antimicrobial peptide transport system permease subunit [Algoriphagus iocasae]
MIKNYFKIALRGFAKHKLTFFINLFGLSLGLWAAILIGLWVSSELSTNKDIPQVARVYQMMEHQSYGADIFTFNSTPGVLAESMKETLAEVELASTYTWMENLLFVQGDKRIKLEGLYAMPDFLKIYDYGVIQGDLNSMLTENNHVVLSESGAISLFGRTDVVGEGVEIKGGTDSDNFIVQGVVKDFPSSSSMKFDYVLPYSLFFAENDWLEDWGNNGPRTVIRLRDGVDGEAFSASIENYILERNEESNVRLFAYPIADYYLHGSWKDGQLIEGRIKNVKLFAMIGIFVLIIACINFMNLSTAKSQKRAKEVGVRKVAGADKGSLVMQFMSESLLITFFSAILAVLLVEATLPIFNNLTGKVMSVPYGSGFFWLELLAIILFTGVVAGSYPAFYLSATKVVSVFRSFTKSGKGVVMARKGLVLFQFILATILIVSTLVVYQQISFAMNQDLGYSKDQLIQIPLEGKLLESFDVFKAELEKNENIESVSRSSFGFLGRNSNTGGVSWEGKDPENAALFEVIRVDYDFIKTSGMELIKGRAFDRRNGADSTSGAILNETAYELMQKDHEGSEFFRLWEDERAITGVVKNFHFESFRQNVAPAILLLDPDNTWQGYVKVNTSNIQETIAYMESTAANLNPEFPFEYSFMDENYARLYQEDVRLRDLAQYFSILTILISCLGLLGLSAHIAEQKTKEIGIRKVLGASTFSILHVINKEFIMIVFLSIVIGSGLAFWVMQDWLDGYQYKIKFEWWFIPLAALTIMGVALITVTFQSLKAAHSNPVKAIKSE